MKFINYLLFGINIIWAVVTIICFLAPAVDPVWFWPPAIIALFLPILIAGHVVFLILWIWKKHKYFWLSLVVLLMSIFPMGNYFQISYEPTIQTRDEIRLLTFNAMRWNHIQDGTNDASQRKAYRELFQMGNRPHIICLQEHHPDGGSLLPDIDHVGGIRGTSIYSRLPIVDSGRIDLGNPINSCIWADIDLGDQGIIRVYNAHLQSNHISDDANRILDSGQLTDSSAWTGVRGIFAKYKRAVIKRAEQAERIKRHIIQSIHPVVLCGDFNDTGLSYAYRVLSEDMKDSFMEKGSGSGSTFAGRIPLLRIDYILLDNSFTILTHEVFREYSSDHYPVMSSVRLTENEF